MTHDPAATPLLSTGIDGLDNILGGGLTPNRLYLVEGDPGAGKTTLGLQIMLKAAASNQVGLYVSLSETAEELRVVAASHGWELPANSVIELAPQEDSLDLDEENTMFHPSELELSEKTKMVLEEVERSKASVVIFDSLSEMRLLAQSPLRYRRQILALKQFFIGRQCTVVMLDDRTAESTDIQLQSLAHGVLTLERRSPEYGVMQRRLQVLKMRGRTFRAGFHDYVIDTGGLRVFPRLVAAEHHEAFPPLLISSGITELDALVGGGLDKGTSTLLIGPAGSGKSSLACQYAMAAASRGHRAIMFLFDEGVGTLVKRTEGLGLPIREAIDAGRVIVRQVDPGELSPGEFVHDVRVAVEELGVQVVVIDSLNGYLNAMPEARFLNLQLHELLTYLAQRGINTILVLAQHGMIGNSMAAPVDVSYLADTVFLLRYFENAGRVRQALSVMKKRSGSHERTLRELHFDNRGLHLGAPLTEFRGVLTGVPTFTGSRSALRESDDDGES